MIFKIPAIHMNSLSNTMAHHFQSEATESASSSSFILLVIYLPQREDNYQTAQMAGADNYYCGDCHNYYKLFDIGTLTWWNNLMSMLIHVHDSLKFFITDKSQRTSNYSHLNSFRMALNSNLAKLGPLMVESFPNKPFWWEAAAKACESNFSVWLLGTSKTGIFGLLAVNTKQDLSGPTWRADNS